MKNNDNRFYGSIFKHKSDSGNNTYVSGRFSGIEERIS